MDLKTGKGCRKKGQSITGRLRKFVMRDKTNSQNWGQMWRTFTSSRCSTGNESKQGPALQSVYVLALNTTRAQTIRCLARTKRRRYARTQSAARWGVSYITAGRYVLTAMSCGRARQTRNLHTQQTVYRFCCLSGSPTGVSGKVAITKRYKLNRCIFVSPCCIC